MAQFFSARPDSDFLEEVKILGNDELLDCWEQTQFMDSVLHGEPADQVQTIAYEQVILRELRLRWYRHNRKPF